MPATIRRTLELREHVWELLGQFSIRFKPIE